MGGVIHESGAKGLFNAGVVDHYRWGASFFGALMVFTHYAGFHYWFFTINEQHDA